MAETSDNSARFTAGIDLSQFYQVFFDEAGENLEAMERMLLEFDVQQADDEALNAIFRCAHSVKGGAATFGFTDVAELTHQMEALLDKLRRRELAPTAQMIDMLLRSGDALMALLARHKTGGAQGPDTTDLLAGFKALCSGQDLAAAQAATATAGVGATRTLEMTVAAGDGPDLADSLVELFHEIIDLGTIEPLDGGHAADGLRRFKLVTSSSDDDLLDLFSFHVSRAAVRLAPFGPGYGFHADAPGAPPVQADSAAADRGYGFFDNAPGAPASPSAPSAAVAAAAALGAGTVAPQARTAGRVDSRASADADATLRVSVDKVDQLINLVGELVITQAMLAQNSKGLDARLLQQLNAGLVDLERNTRDLQQAVMSIRMIPMSTVFNRFPRMLRDLAGRLGKKVELVTVGETTELDKGMVEKITDPLTHLLRNSCDHGIELPAERRARGKPEQGTLTLVAGHQGGSIVIEVRDDGKGLNRQKLLQTAREKGLDAPDSLSDLEVWNLIFAPGFSTVEVVTDVSGRGVGMDVVKKNITALGGTVDIDSAEGYGMSVKVRLPLTLAIMDGMSVGVGDECYILPLGSVVESFQVQPGMVKRIGGSGRVVQVRNVYMPVVDMAQVFAVPRARADSADSADGAAGTAGIMVVVESEGAHVALLVDELLGQHQVVVKNLESNYRRVNDVSGATIMGDGRVALILDTGALVRRGGA